MKYCLKGVNKGNVFIVVMRCNFMFTLYSLDNVPLSQATQILVLILNWHLRTLLFPLMLAWTTSSCWTNPGLAGDVETPWRSRDATVMMSPIIFTFWYPVSKGVVFMMTSSNGNIFRVTGPLCGEFTGPGEFPAQRPVTRSFDVFFDLRTNKRLSKQPWGWWFETPSWSLWRHCNVAMWPFILTWFIFIRA